MVVKTNTSLVKHPRVQSDLTLCQPTNIQTGGGGGGELGGLTVHNEAGGGALGAPREGVELAGVAGLVLGPQLQQREVAAAQAGAQVNSALKGRPETGLGVAAGEPGDGGGLLALLSAPAPQHLKHLLREAVVAGEGELLPTHCCLVAVLVHPP